MFISLLHRNWNKQKQTSLIVRLHKEDNYSPIYLTIFLIDKYSHLLSENEII